MNEKYLLVSLGDEQSKKIAAIIGNDTCRKILDYLSEKDSSETDISTALHLPLSTVHYNIQNLHASGLVQIRDFTWSEKGNKINIYRIAKKLIVIAPKGQAMTSHLKNIIPTAFISIGVAALIYALSGLKNVGVDSVVEKATSDTELAREVASQAVSQAAMAPAEALTNTTIATIQNAHFYDPAYSALWFLFGALFTIVLYIIITTIRSKKT